MEQETARWIVLLLSVLGGGLIGLLRRPPILLVLLLNLVPVAGVLWLGWSPLQLLLLYWVENVAVGAVNSLKLRGYEARGAAETASPFKLSSFFMLHYGLFTLVHGVFALIIGSLFVTPGANAGNDWLSFGGGVLALSVIHLGDYLRWRETRGWERGSADAQMFAPYGRVIVMHLTVLVGAFILLQTKAPAAYIVLLAVLKTFIETGWALMGDKQMAAGRPTFTLEINGKPWRPK